MLLREASTLDVGKYPLSCAFVLRAVVELAVNDYMDANSLPRGQKGSKEQFDLKRKADDVLKKFFPSALYLRPFCDRSAAICSTRIRPVRFSP